MPGVYRLDNLRPAREAAGLTVDALARRARLNHQYVTNLEAGGACEPHEAQRIADALGVSLEELGASSLIG